MGEGGYNNNTSTLMLLSLGMDWGFVLSFVCGGCPRDFYLYMTCGRVACGWRGGFWVSRGAWGSECGIRGGKAAIRGLDWGCEKRGVGVCKVL